MSASETSISSKPQWRITRDDDDHAADDHVDPARFEAGIVAALLDRLGRERAEHLLGRRPRQTRQWWMRSLSLASTPSSIAAIVHTVPAVPMSVFACAAPGIAAVDVGEVVAHHRHRLAQLLGRRRIGVQVLLGEPHAADVDRHQPLRRVGRPTMNSVEPPPTSTTR